MRQQGLRRAVGREELTRLETPAVGRFHVRVFVVAAAPDHVRLVAVAVLEVQQVLLALRTVRRRFDDVVDDEVPGRLRTSGGALRERRKIVSPSRLAEVGARSEQVGVRITLGGPLINGVAIARRELGGSRRNRAV